MNSKKDNNIKMKRLYNRELIVTLDDAHAVSKRVRECATCREDLFQFSEDNYFRIEQTGLISNDYHKYTHQLIKCFYCEAYMHTVCLFAFQSQRPFECPKCSEYFTDYEFARLLAQLLLIFSAHTSSYDEYKQVAEIVCKNMDINELMALLIDGRVIPEIHEMRLWKDLKAYVGTSDPMLEAGMQSYSGVMRKRGMQYEDKIIVHDKSMRNRDNKTLISLLISMYADITKSTTSLQLVAHYNKYVKEA
ncbi:hypothetical protein ENBRE01_0614 [Enteropsectra breve]|nr:hypothetical protein ENBRE01_0614 [Enteropsectra breve]